MFLLSIFGLFYFKSSPFFIQLRGGKSYSSFKMIKFKTLFGPPPIHPSLSNDLERLTKYGLFLRKTNLDELPQLLNIIFGQMNFFGPRPLPIQYNDRLTQYQLKRTLIKPGLLGLVQVSGGNNLSWNHRFRYDVFYCKNKNKIILNFIILERFFNRPIKASLFSESLK